MKSPYATLAILTGVSVICSSCVAPYEGYASYAVPGGVNVGATWTNASYDANGFPIFGYSYGRPVYGYTSTGAAIFSIAALTALCFVPYWGPARWYHGPYYYPRGIHRVPAPPRFPHGHNPGMRPPGGIQPPPRPKAPAPMPGGGHFGSPGPVSPALRGPGPAISTMPAPRGARMAPVPKAASPGVGGVSIPKPSAPGAVSPKPAISTMPAPGGVNIPKATIPSASAPKISTMPAAGGFSIPKPAGASAPTTVRIGPPASASGGGHSGISTMRTSMPMPRGARR